MAERQRTSLLGVGITIIIVLFILTKIKANVAANREAQLQARRAQIQQAAKEAAQAPEPPFTPPDYKKAFCEDNHDTRFESDEVTVPLSPGCFKGKYIFPKHWDNYAVSKSQHDGDWAAVWCEGKDHPQDPRPAWQDFDPHYFDRCGAFWIQGKGTAHFTMTTKTPW